MAIASTSSSIASVAAANVSWGEVRHFVCIVFSIIAEIDPQAGMQYNPGQTSIYLYLPLPTRPPE